MSKELDYLMKIASELPDDKRVEYANRFMRHDKKVVTLVNNEWFIDGQKPSKMMCEALDSAVAGYYGFEIAED